MTESVRIVLAEHLNGAGRLFGGTLMAWIDEIAAVTARRHAGVHVTTACIDHLSFLKPAHEDQTVILRGELTYTGTTSMEVRVSTYVESLGGQRDLINVAYLVLVALDERGDPTPVPPLIPVGDEEKEDWEAALARRAFRTANAGLK